MLEPKKVFMDGLCFDLQALPALKAIGLDKKILTLAIPVLGGIKEFSLDANIDLEVISKGLFEALSALKENDFENLIQDLLSTTVYIPEGATPIELSKININRIFQGQITTLYKLIFEVMKFNKFTPFVLAGGGKVTSIIDTFVRPMKRKNKLGKKLEKSESSQEILMQNGLSGESS